jgi:urate oxidase
MKNYILRQGLVYDGATIEGFLEHLGRGFLESYAQMESLRLTARELRFDAVAGALYTRSDDDHGVAVLGLDRGDGIRVTSVRSGRVGLRLMKLTGSAFTHFVRDEYTTLPERRDRPLYIAMDVHWHYADAADAVSQDPARHVASEDVRDLVAEVFAEFVSESIQHLVHEMGVRLLDRFGQLREVSFAAQNRTRDPVAQEGDTHIVYSDPFPAYGTIALTVARA